MAYKDSDLLIIVNGHGGNHCIASAVCSNYNYTNNAPKAMVVSVFSDSTRDLAKELLGDFNAHADSVESSVFAAMCHEIAEGNYQLEKIDEVSVPKNKLKYFPARYISKQGIITSEKTLKINREIGQMLITNSVNSIINQIHKTLEIVKDGTK